MSRETGTLLQMGGLQVIVGCLAIKHGHGVTGMILLITGVVNIVAAVAPR